MADNVGDPFDDIGSEDEELEKPPTPEIHHGGDSPDAPGFSDISDNEQEETTKEEAPIESSEDSNDSASINSPGKDEKSAKEDNTTEEKHVQQGSPVYDQEMSPVSSTAEHAKEEENESEKVEENAHMNEEETTSLTAKISEETTAESTKSKQGHSESNIEGENTSGLEESAVTEETGEEIHGGRTAGYSSDPENTKERRRRISSGAGTDDDMPISPLGLGLSGTESDLVEDILQSDVSKLLPDIKEDSQEESIGIILMLDEAKLQNTGPLFEPFKLARRVVSCH